MKYLAIVLLALLPSCSLMSNEMTSKERTDYVALLNAKDNALARGDMPAAQTYERQIRELEAQVLDRRSGPVRALIKAIYPPAAPLADYAWTLLAGIPLIGKRGRKHFLDMVKEATPGVAGNTGTKLPNLAGVAQSLVKYVGASHTEQA